MLNRWPRYLLRLDMLMGAQRKNGKKSISIPENGPGIDKMCVNVVLFSLTRSSKHKQIFSSPFLFLVTLQPICKTRERVRVMHFAFSYCLEHVWHGVVFFCFQGLFHDRLFSFFLGVRACFCFFCIPRTSFRDRSSRVREALCQIFAFSTKGENFEIAKPLILSY